MGKGKRKEKSLSVGRASLQSSMLGLCHLSPGQTGCPQGCDFHDGCPSARGAAPRTRLGAVPLARAPMSGDPRHLQSGQAEMLHRAQCRRGLQHSLGAAGSGGQTRTPVWKLLPADKPLGNSFSAPKWLDVTSALPSSPGLLQSLTIFLEVLEGVQSVIPKDKFLAITSAVFYQLYDDTKQHSEADSTELTHCILLQARICPEETILFLQSQLEDECEAGRVAALGLLGTLACSDEPLMTEKLPLVAEAVQRLCSDLRPWVRMAILYFIKDLLSADTPSCSAWDMVGHIFREFSRTTGRRAAGDLPAQEAQEERALQQLCMDILGSLNVSVGGMSKLLWPRLLLFVLSAQYTGMLILVSCCVQALAEREGLTTQEIEELDPHFLSSMFQGPQLAPQTLLVRLLVVAGSPVAGSELQAAALLLMQKLHSRIHRAVGAMWEQGHLPLD
ncbi:maestro heat-like repeat-containing protein family member 2B isoform X2 [Meleagris gallopavo]|uniref:maestro heat-like repeat-containing protein family member 2B isoform X2 n=1 Tax=Meleagris gallopavo TaxID=9103 RepID=UPI00093D254C|nr:maestro heat-like repeat-containing protein family member 2B isoform X2 [Meleagris gallopavo]